MGEAVAMDDLPEPGGTAWRSTPIVSADRAPTFAPSGIGFPAGLRHARVLSGEAGQLMPRGGGLAAARMAASYDPRAFYACARAVVRRIESMGAIATFAGGDIGAIIALGEGRYRLESYFDEAAESGQTERRLFTCTVRFGGHRWDVEELAITPSTLSRGATPISADCSPGATVHHPTISTVRHDRPRAPGSPANPRIHHPNHGVRHRPTTEALSPDLLREP